jgi:hypothetical protein
VISDLALAICLRRGENTGLFRSRPRSCWMARGCWAGLAAALLGAVPYARAEASQIVLDAELPAQLAGCITVAQLNDSYQRALGAYGGDEFTKDMQLRAAVTGRAGADAGTTLLQIAAFDADRPLGTRELPVRTDDCAALPDALGLVLALMTRDAPPPAASPVPSTPATPELRLQPMAAEAPRPATPQPSAHLALGIGAGAVFGVLPSGALSLQLQAATPGERVSLRLKAGLLWPQEIALAEGFIELRSYELGLDVCAGLPWPGWPRLWLRLCGGPRVARMLGRGREFNVDNLSANKWAVYFALAPELAVRLASATWLQLGAGAALAAVRPRFQVGIDGGRQVVELKDPGLLRGELGLSLVQKF